MQTSSLRVSFVFAVGISLGCAACKDHVEEIRQAQAATRSTDRVPPQAVGYGTDPDTGLPLGYPPRLPLVPGGRALSGGVDPGVIRTATLVYDGMSVQQYVDALNAALTANGQRLVRTFDTETGSKQLRVDLGSGYASVVVTDNQGQVRVDISAIDRATPTP